MDWRKLPISRNVERSKNSTRLFDDSVIDKESSLPQDKYNLQKFLFDVGKFSGFEDDQHSAHLHNKIPTTLAIDAGVIDLEFPRKKRKTLLVE